MQVKVCGTVQFSTPCGSCWQWCLGGVKHGDRRIASQDDVNAAMVNAWQMSSFCNFQIAGLSLSPLRIPCRHRPLHVQTRLARPPAPPPPGTSDPGFQVLNSPNGPISFSFNGLTGGTGSLSLVLDPFICSPPTGIRRRPVLRFPRPQDEYSIFCMQRHASSNS